MVHMYRYVLLTLQQRTLGPDNRPTRLALLEFLSVGKVKLSPSIHALLEFLFVGKVKLSPIIHALLEFLSVGKVKLSPSIHIRALAVAKTDSTPDPALRLDFLEVLLLLYCANNFRPLTAYW